MSKGAKGSSGHPEEEVVRAYVWISSMRTAVNDFSFRMHLEVMMIRVIGLVQTTDVQEDQSNFLYIC